MYKITAILTAVEKLAHQIHLNFKDYGEHLLADRLRDGIPDDIDRLKELSYVSAPEISNAYASLTGAAQYLKEIPETKDINELFDYLLQLELEAVRLITAEIPKSKSEGIKNALGDICEKRERDIYLLRGRLKNA
jgi:hypothetical protein